MIVLWVVRFVEERAAGVAAVVPRGVVEKLAKRSDNPDAPPLSPPWERCGSTNRVNRLETMS
jgi:hypothetical protein